MSKLHVSLLAVLLIALASLTVLAVNKYEHSNNGLTLVQAIAERDSARHGAAVEQSISSQYQSQLVKANAQITTITSQKSTLCAEIVKYHLVQPLCQP